MGAILDSSFNIKTSIPAITNSDITSVMLNLTIAVILGFLLSLLYKRIQPVSKVKKTFLHTLVLLPLVAAAVTLIIGNNLVRAFGLIGAIAVIRFRTVIKNTTDMVYIFMAITLGMAFGSGLFAVGSVALGIFGLSEAVLRRRRYGIKSNDSSKYEIILKADNAEEARKEFQGKMTNLFHSVKLKDISASSPVTITYKVRLSKNVSEEKIMSTLFNGNGEIIKDIRLKKK